MDLILTVDVEDWYQTNGYNFPPETWGNYEERVVANTMKLLDLLDKKGAKGTFFVLGYVAEKHPDLVKEIYSRGHEIGCHSYYHQMINQGDREAVVSDIARAKHLLEGIIGQEVKGFRAPSWSLGPQETWLYQELITLGFQWDSSLQPFKTPLSGFHQGPTEPFRPIIGDKTLEIVEFPVSVCKFGIFRIPYSGGFYLRVIPYGLAKYFLKRQNDRTFAMVYLHPWEIDPERPRIKTSLCSHLIHGINTRCHSQKIEKLIEDFNLKPLGEFFVAGTFKSFKLKD